VSVANPTLRPRLPRPIGRPDPSPDAARPGARAAMPAPALPARQAEPARRAEPARPPLEVVPAGSPSPRWRRLRRRLLGIAGIILALTTLFGLVLVHVELTTRELRLTRLQAQAQQAQEHNLKLRLQVSQLESPARIVATAKQLGLVPAPSITYLPGAAGVAGATAATGAAGAASATASGTDQSGVQSWSAAKRADTTP
jgi:cell division protein FtsL